LAIAPSPLVAARATLPSASAVAVHDSASTASTDPWESNALDGGRTPVRIGRSQGESQFGDDATDGKRPSARNSREAPLAILRRDRRER
jgi:hypothetical protein